MSRVSAAAPGRAALALPALVIVVLGVMVVPLPPFILDLLITTNLMASVVVLMVALTIRRPVEFSAFPSLLLVLTLFRLSLNIASTRLILLGGETGEGAAGDVIKAFGQFVVGGEPIVGASVFLALIVIQYVVINHGAVRVSEVIARFTLDAMPGKQMSVDADLNSGAITEEEAKHRRREIGREAEFYGSMDGAVRFSQRDSIAAVILLAINILAGLGLGIFKFGMPAGSALKLFTILTIGDGIVAAIPALFVSVAGGIIATRAAAEGALGDEVATQLLRVRQPLIVAGIVLGVLALIPGLPKLPFFLLAAACAFAAHHITRREAALEVEEQAAPLPLPAPEPEFAELVRVEAVSVDLGFSLLSLADDAVGGDLLSRVKTVRRQVSQELGLPVPAIRVRDQVDLPAQAYRVKVHDAVVGRGTLLPHSLLAILPGDATNVPEGIPAKDPTFGLPARWIRPADRERAVGAGCTVVEPTVVLATHLGQVLRREAWRLLGRKESREMLEAVQEGTADEVVPKLVSLGVLQQVLRSLLKEGVSLRDGRTIIDAIALGAETSRDPDALTARVRVALGPAICSARSDAEGKLKVFSLGPDLEERLRTETKDGGPGPELVVAVADGVRRAFASVPGEAEHVLLCSPAVRGHLRRVMERVYPGATVVSHAEIPDSLQLVRLGTVA